MKKALLAIALFVCAPISIHAWDSTDQDTGENVEIESGNMVQDGNDIEVYGHHNIFFLPFALANNIYDRQRTDLLFSSPKEEQLPHSENIKMIARSGCCSHHRGVCGCDQALDRIECCDGTLSPSCTCSGYLTQPMNFN